MLPVAYLYFNIKLSSGYILHFREQNYAPNSLW